MKNLRKYGKAPFDIAVIHSDPSEREEMYINGEKKGICQPNNLHSSNSIQRIKNVGKKI